MHLPMCKLLSCAVKFNNSRRLHLIRSLLTYSSCSKDVNVQGNVILMGSPGCGKTTVGRILAEKLRRQVFDIDDHHLEPYWGVQVSQKLAEVGSDGFVKAEGEALMNFNAVDSVISLTGSNPMHENGMKHISSSGTVVFLDVHMQDILERLERMQVQRIVGQNDGVCMMDILKYRQQFYERWYDIRIICERHESPELIADKVITSLQATEKPGYESTRGLDMSEQNFNDVLLQGLAPDGGLIVPQKNIPKMSLGQLLRLMDFNYNERALMILEQWINYTHVHPRILRQAINRAYSCDTFASMEVCPVLPLGHGSGRYIQELFHGPTASFKDISLQLMPQLFVHAVNNDKHPIKYLILVATTGDTGGAVLDGFARHTGESDVSIGVLVLYPLGGVSEIQSTQMTSYSGSKARVVGVDGADFDFCQTTVKKIFNDHQLNETIRKQFNQKLSAANSISWGRLLPQVVYHVSSYLDLVKQKVIGIGESVDLCVPTGNFGNILAAYYAKEMGVPFRRLVCASDVNNVLTDFINTGCYDITCRKLQQTTSPAINILVSSNLERLIFDITRRDSKLVRTTFEQLQKQRKFQLSNELMHSIRETFRADWSTEQQCAETIRQTLSRTGYLVDTHTAVAVAVADRFQEDRPMVITSTAHPGKFAKDILAILGHNPGTATPRDMMKDLQELVPNMAGHKALIASLEKTQFNKKNVCKASQDIVVGEVMNFAKTL